jgi:predicted nucleotidyltransferase
MTTQFPDTFQKDIARATEILRSAGCTHVYLFGSLTHGNINPESDIDLAVRGCARGQYFRVLGKLLLELDHPVDLVDLDRNDSFARFLESEGELAQIA